MKQIHVNQKSNSTISDGSINNPYKSIKEAIKYIEKGTELIIHEGVYEPFSIYKEASGTKEEPVTIKNYNNEKVIIQGIFDEDSRTVYLENVDNITIEGLEIIGGGLGIYYESTTAIKDRVLENITISNCVVHKIRGMHGIAVYAKNYFAPVKNLIMKNCHVYDCRLDSSESTVFNGNIDGFIICNNKIHDNNNIGIDMIGFEGKAKKDISLDGNLYEVDFVRNGKCYNNFVYNISSFDNEAYFENPLASILDTKGENNLCANGIYVDGGQDIEIYNNFVYNCDIGIEVATEHSPDDNELFKVENVDVHDNVICNCIGYSGLAIGGYAKNLGFTKNCNFHNNTFIDNNIGMIVQRTKDNNIKNNIFIGGNLGIEFNHGVLIDDQVNNFDNNIFCTNIDINNYFDLDGKDLNYLMKNNLQSQSFITNKNEIVDNYQSLKEGMGSLYIPDVDEIESLNKYINIGLTGINKASKYLFDNFSTIDLKAVLKEEHNICHYLNNKFKENNLSKAYVELIKVNGDDTLLTTLRNEENGKINKEPVDINNSVSAEFHLRYEYDNESYAHMWIKKILIK